MDPYFKLDVHVTAEDIEKGIPLRVQFCPIAHAITRAATKHFPTNYTHWGVMVNKKDASILVHRDDQIAEYDAIMPNEARHFIEQFDKKHPTEPFSFTAEFWIDTISP